MLRLTRAVKHALMLVTVVGGLSFLGSTASAQYVSNWATTVQPVGNSPKATLWVNTGNGKVPQLFFAWKDANNNGPDAQPIATWFQARVFCYTNSAHTGSALLIYSSDTQGQSNPLFGMSCPSDHPFWHKPTVKVSSWGFSSFTYP
jgi:hypothetical protein